MWYECRARLTAGHPICGHRLTSIELDLAKFDTCPKCGEGLIHYWQVQDTDDIYENWTCIPGRICGGADFMRKATARINKLEKIISSQRVVHEQESKIIEEQDKIISSMNHAAHAYDGTVEERDKLIEKLEAVVDAAKVLQGNANNRNWIRLRKSLAALDREPIRDASCLDAGCDIEGKEPHRPGCDHFDKEKT